MKSIRDIGIVTKLVGINTILMLLVLSVIAVFIFVHEKQRYIEELQSNGKLIAEGLANNAALPIMTRNLGLMEAMLKSAMRFESVDRISTYDKNKDLLSWVSDNPGLPGEPSIALWPSDKMTQYLQESEGILDTSIPVYMERIGPSGEGLGFAEDILFDKEEGKGELVGYVHLGMSTSKLQQRVTDFAAKLISAIFVLALLGIVLINLP